MSWNVKLISLILISTVIDYVLGIKIGEATEPKAKKRYLTLSVCANLGILGFFKYFNFFVSEFVELINGIGLNIPEVSLHIILPVGISFYTFQTMSYSIDVYRGKLKPVKNFLDFSLYVAFFPQLVAGPIVKARDFIPQLFKPRHFRQNWFVLGMGLFLLGMLKKIFFADLLANAHVDLIFKEYDKFGSIDILLAIYGYAIQIYADFSGYSDMAIGIALCFGYRLRKNFNYPYIAQNISEFWKRWHISLSTWLREYLYIPLGGNRVSAAKIYRNLLITMFLGGLWHGASKTFIVWGVYHGLLLCAYHFIKPKISKLKMPSFWKKFLTFHCVALGWIIFRVDKTKHVRKMLKIVFSIEGLKHTVHATWLVVALLAIAFIYHCIYNKKIKSNFLAWYIKGGSVSVAISLFIILCLACFAEGFRTPFIYFQF